MPGRLSPAIFLDRDGTVIEEVGYCHDPAQVRLLPGTAEALVQLKQNGYKLILISNQSGIGRGYLTESDCAAVQSELLRQLPPNLIDAAYHCPHAPGTPCDCRKPAPGMILQAAAEHAIDLTHSWMIGDKATDIECGQRASIRTALVLTGYGSEQQALCSPDLVVKTLADFCSNDG